MSKKKLYLCVYAILLIVLFGFICYAGNYDNTHNHRKVQSERDVMIWSDYDTFHLLDNTSTVKGTIDVDSTFGNILFFKTIHQNVEVYIEDSLIYQYPAKEDIPFMDSPGYSWHFITLPYGVNNIKIVTSSPYPDYGSRSNQYFIGNNSSAAVFVLRNTVIPSAICLLIFFSGMAMIVYYISTKVRRLNTVKSSLLYLGMFAILLSIWSANETTIFDLLFYNSIASVYVAFGTLMFLPVTFGLYAHSMYEDSRAMWTIYLKVNMLQVAFCIFCQVTGLLDFVYTVWSTHVMLVYLAVLTIYSAIKTIKEKKHFKRPIIHVALMLFVALCLFKDLFSFYDTAGDTHIAGRFSFLIYFVIIGIMSLRESAELMKKGQKANEFESLAYNDQMTGLLNRTKFNIDFDQFSKNPENIMIINFDLNFLKRINDGFGHSAGDLYIKTSADIIRHVFEGVGNCYRVGGDEFAAIIPNASSVDYNYFISRLEWNIDEFNKTNKSFKMNIAHGMAIYDSTLDANLEATYNRADKAMYINKKEKKG